MRGSGDTLRRALTAKEGVSARVSDDVQDALAVFIQPQQVRGLSLLQGEEREFC